MSHSSHLLISGYYRITQENLSEEIGWRTYQTEVSGPLIFIVILVKIKLELLEQWSL